MNKAIIPAAIRGRYDGGVMQKLELRPDLCTNTLTSVQKDNVLVEYVDIGGSSEQMDCDKPINIGNVNPSGHGMNGAVFDASAVSPTLTTNKGEGIKVRVEIPPLSLSMTITTEGLNQTSPA